MRRFVALAIAAAIALGAAPALAGSDVRASGSCSAQGDWKLKLSPNDSRIEVEFEVDQNVVGDTWRVRMTRDGDEFFRGRRTTRAPSGSFEVRKLVDDAAGTDRIVAKAVNTSTDESVGGSPASEPRLDQLPRPL